MQILQSCANFCFKFFQERLSKSRVRDRLQKSDRDDVGALQDESPSRKKFSRCYTQDSNYSADNSSEHSNSLTPQTQSPFHAVKHKTSSSPSWKFQKLKSKYKLYDLCTLIRSKH